MVARRPGACNRRTRAAHADRGRSVRAGRIAVMRYRLRTLLIVLALGPPAIAGCYFVLRETSAPLWAIALGIAQVVFWFVMLTLVVRGALSRKSVPKPP
jgi:hypothetical protein